MSRNNLKNIKCLSLQTKSNLDNISKFIFIKRKILWYLINQSTGLCYFYDSRANTYYYLTPFFGFASKLACTEVGTSYIQCRNIKHILYCYGIPQNNSNGIGLIDQYRW